MIERVPCHTSRVGCGLLFLRIELPEEIVQMITRFTDTLFKRCIMCNTLYTFSEYTEHVKLINLYGIDPKNIVVFGIRPHVEYKTRYGIRTGDTTRPLSCTVKPTRSLPYIPPTRSAIFEIELVEVALPKPPAPPPVRPKQKPVAISLYNCDSCGRAITGPNGKGGISSNKGNFCNKRCQTPPRK